MESSSHHDCPDENMLLAWASAKLSPAGAQSIDRHVDECPRCRAAVADAAHTLDNLSASELRIGTFSRGSLLSQRYRIQLRLGAGGMGEVYEADDCWLEEPVAVKTIAATIADDDQALARLKAEVRLARRVTHVNVCRVFDLGFHATAGEQIAYLTMELLRGRTLRRHLSASGRMQPDAALPLIEQMIAGLKHAHAAGIVHRDFKSDNVMLVDGPGPKERVVIMDFGLARSALVSESQPLTPHSHTVLGTLDYMSPEQVTGGAATCRSDIFALGVVIYEMLTGSLPFAGESALARALARVTHPARRLRESLPTIDRRWDECVARCLSVDPADRYESMDDVMAALASEPRRAPRVGRAGYAIAAGGLLALALWATAAARSMTVVEAPAHAAALRPPVLTPPSSPTPSAAHDVAAVSSAEPTLQKRSEPRPPTLPAPPRPPPRVSVARSASVPVSPPLPPSGDALLRPGWRRGAEERPGDAGAIESAASR